MKPSTDSLALVRTCCRALDEKKAGEIKVLDVSAISSITNYLVIATATSEPHVRALRIELEKAVDATKTRILGFDATRESGWSVMDAFDVMVHVFTAECRERYGLERLWKDGKELGLAAVLETPKTAVKKKAVRKKAAPKARKPKRK